MARCSCVVEHAECDSIERIVALARSSCMFYYENESGFESQTEGSAFMCVCAHSVEMCVVLSGE